VENQITGTYLKILKEFKFKNFKDKSLTICNPVARTFQINHKDFKTRNHRFNNR